MEPQRANGTTEPILINLQAASSAASEEHERQVEALQKEASQAGQFHGGVHSGTMHLFSPRRKRDSTLRLRFQL